MGGHKPRDGGAWDKVEWLNGVEKEEAGDVWQADWGGWKVKTPSEGHHFCNPSGLGQSGTSTQQSARARTLRVPQGPRGPEDNAGTEV